jgi:hypothetical protein
MTRGSTRISWSGPGLLEGGAWLTPAGFAGLQIGLPVGLVVGRLLWHGGRVRACAVRAAGRDRRDGIVPAVWALVSLLGMWPGHRAARLRVANPLRAGQRSVRITWRRATGPSLLGGQDRLQFFTHTRPGEHARMGVHHMRTWLSW